jgi:hypothetical protein
MSNYEKIEKIEKRKKQNLEKENGTAQRNRQIKYRI